MENALRDVKLLHNSTESLTCRHGEGILSVTVTVKITKSLLGPYKLALITKNKKKTLWTETKL